MLRRLAVTAVLASLIAAAPAAAQTPPYVTVQVVEGQSSIVFEGSEAADRVVYTGFDGFHRFDSDDPFTPSSVDRQPAFHGESPCGSSSPGTAYCPSGPVRIHARGGGGEDYLNFVLSTLPVEIHGGAGDDFLLEGSDGFGDRIFGEAGDDRLSDFAGNDALFGGDGNDDLFLGLGTDSADGGDGSDQANAFYRETPMEMTMTSIVDTSTGETDSLTSVERLYGGRSDDRMTGGDGDDELHGGEGGKDQIVGGGGRDVLLGGFGDDVIDARDGVVDYVDCGRGQDIVTADSVDVVQATCEDQRIDDALVPDADSDGSRKPADCNDRDPGVRPGAAEVPNNGKDDDCRGNGDAKDADGDSYSSDVDCVDTSAAIHPGARDVRGDRVDQDCVGGDAPASRLDVRIPNQFRAATTTRVLDLRVLDLARGMTVRVLCKGGGCPAKDKRYAIRNGKPLDLRKRLFAKSRLRPGAVVEIRISAPEFHAEVHRFTIRKLKLPLSQPLCLPIGASKPVKRC